MFKLNLVTPEKKIVWGQELEKVTLPAFKGELTILKGHSPMLSTLLPGIIRFELKSGETKKLAVSWGYCQVYSEGVNILTELAVEKDEVQLDVVKTKLKDLQNQLFIETLDNSRWEAIQTEIQRLKAEQTLVEH